MTDRLTCGMKYFCLGAVLIFAGSVLLCGLGIVVIIPYELTRHWPEATCHVINSSVSTWICSCERDVVKNGVSATRSCLSDFPCLQISVQYVRIDTGTKSKQTTETWQIQAVTNSTVLTRDESNATTIGYIPSNRSQSVGLLRGDVSQSLNDTHNLTLSGMLYRSWDDAFYRTCSLHECASENWNMKEVHRFNQLWGRPGHTFPCYYDPDDATQVILERTPTSQMIHAVLWPSVFLFTGLVIWLGLWVGCWEVDMEKYSQLNVDRKSESHAVECSLFD